MNAMFDLIDTKTGDVFGGPYVTFSEARAQANRFTAWEIVSDGQLICERCAPQQTDEAFVPH